MATKKKHFFFIDQRNLFEFIFFVVKIEIPVPDFFQYPLTHCRYCIRHFFSIFFLHFVNVDNCYSIDLATDFQLFFIFILICISFGILHAILHEKSFIHFDDSGESFNSRISTNHTNATCVWRKHFYIKFDKKKWLFLTTATKIVFFFHIFVLFSI